MAWDYVFRSSSKNYSRNYVPSAGIDSMSFKIWQVTICFFELQPGVGIDVIEYGVGFDVFSVVSGASRHFYDLFHASELAFESPFSTFACSYIM